MADRHAEKRGYLQSTPLIGRAAVGRTCSQSPCQPSAPCRMPPSIHVAGLRGRAAREAAVLGERVANPAAGHVRGCCGRECCMVGPPWRKAMSEADVGGARARQQCRARYVACLLAGLHDSTICCAVGPAPPPSAPHARRRRLLRAHSPSACARSGNGPLHQLHGRGISICDRMPA